MATPVFMPGEQYLSTSFEHDPEYADGEIVARGTGTNNHSAVQMRLAGIFYGLQKSKHLCGRTEVHLRVRANAYRVPDFCLYEGLPPLGRYPSDPPMLVVEILSPDDRLSVLEERIAEYEAFGVRYIWVVDPEHELCFSCENGKLLPVAEFELPSHGVRLSHAELFTD